MKHTDEHLRYVEILIHVIGWGIVFGFPLLMMNRSGMGITWADYLRHGCVVPLSFLVVFYVNYFVLIPRYLFAGRMRTYIIMCCWWRRCCWAVMFGKSWHFSWTNRGLRAT